MEKLNFKSLILALTLLTIGTGQMWAYNFNSPKIYFNNANLNWNPAMLLVGHNSYSVGYDQTSNPITNTKLVYFAPSCSWGDQDGFTIGQASGWGGDNTQSFTKRAGYLTHIGLQYSYGFDGNTYYVTGTTGVSPTISVNYISSGYGGIQKYNATQGAKWRDTGTSYSITSGTWPATLKLKGTYLSGDGASTQSTITSTASTDGDAKKVYGAVVTGEITHSYESLSSSYYFEGWGTGSTPTITDDTHTYNISAATTYYAFFSHLYTLGFDVKGTPGTSTIAVSVANYDDVDSGDKVPTGHTITANATIATGYEIVGWYSDASCTSAYTNGSGGVTISGAGNKTFSITSLNSNSGIYCKLRKKTYSITLNDDGDYQGDGSATVQRGDAALTVSSHARRDGWNLVGYWNTSAKQVTDAEGVLLTSVSDYTDGSGHWIYDGDVTLYAHWSQTYSLTVSAGSNISSVTGSNADVTLNTKYAISATPVSGYSFSGWTASPSDNGVFDNASSASTNVTVKNGSVTVTAAATEIMRSITISGGHVYDGVATSTTAGVVTKAKVVANAPAAGKKFTGWSLGSGVSLADGYALTDQTIEITSTADATVTANYANRAGVKMYFAKPPVWGADALYAYAWKNGDDSKKNATYPGVEISTTEVINCVTYYVYQYYNEGDGIGGSATGNSAWDRVIFGCNDDNKKTGNLTISNGHYYYWNSSTTGAASAVSDVWYIKGTMNDWGTTNPIVHDCANHKGTASINLTKGTTYEFKVYDVVNTKMWSNSTACGGDNIITATMPLAQTLYNDDENVMKITANVTGPYTFEVSNTNTTSPKIKVTFPTAYTVTFGASPTAAADAPTNNKSITSGSLVLSGTEITFTKDATPNSGYSWKGWYDNSAGTGDALGTGSTYTTTISAATTVYAVYTEDMHNVTINAQTGGTVSYNGGAAGSSSTARAGIATASANIVATAATGYYFVGWQLPDGTITKASESAYNGATSTCTINATADSKTVTALFNVRYALLGSTDADDAVTGGMPGWGEGNESPFAYSDGTYTKEVSLTIPNSTYKFRIVDRRGASHTSYGLSSKAVIPADAYYHDLASTAADAQLATAGVGTYTLKVQTNASGYPKVMITNQESYSVTFGYGTGGSAVTASGSTSGSITSGQYVAAGEDVTFTQTPASDGYTFKGWYDAASGGSAIASMGTSDNVYDDIAANATVYAQYTANTYTLSFDVNGGTASTPDSRSVTYGSAYGALPTGMTHASKTFIGWYTTESGAGTHVTAETIVSTASNHTLYARYEDVYSVNVNFKCGDATVYPATSVSASPTSLAPTITAPEIFGYSFVNWTGSNATFADANSATTTVNATAATTVTANYAVVPTVYFKNNLGWENVYVTFNAYFDGSHENAPGNYDKPYFQMTQIGTSDIYYCAIPSTYTTSDYASWAWNIAFDNTGFSASDNVGTKTGAFDSGEFTGRGDFDPKTTLFIPYNGDTETRNGGTFYASGCWMKYNSTESGYQVNMNTWVNGEHDDTLTVQLTAANAGGYEFSAKLNLKRPNYSYGFKLYKIYQKNTTDLWFTNTGEITAATTTLPWDFVAGASITATSQRCALHTEALGDYTITVSFATGKPMVDVEYPASVGDWRLAYNDRIAWSGSAHDASWYLYSSVIKAKANAKDTASFYVSKADGASASIELQKCTAINPSTGAETWTKQSDVLLSSITKTGFYNFQVTQNGSKEASAAYLEPYNGNFYIRTDVADGGWANYKTSGKNQMTYSEYAEENNDYTHYYMRYVETGSNIKFCIANDYNPRVTEFCVSDSYTNEWIEANGNVRFMWNAKTNAISRAYISGSGYVEDRFLVLEGDDRMFDESGKALTDAGGGKISGLNDYEMKFTDDQNWIYEATIKAQPKAKVKLTAKYNDKIQYFYGAEGTETEDSVLLIDGTGTDKYKMRIVYDFKTNRLIKAFIPDGAISTGLAIDADMMIIREHQEDAQQITFNVGGSLSKVKTVYGAMKFNKYTVNGKEKTGGHAATGASRYERDLFYISFPFDVKLSDAFGFGTYGKHWILEYYDGKGRAANGFWVDSDPNWKFVMPAQRNSFTMKAFEGYILALDLDEMTESASIWDNDVEDVYIYFPSNGDVGNISATNRLVTIDQDDYKCTINRPTADGNRTIKDSYWHCIGVPSFANYSSALSPTDGGATIDWTSTSMPYLYEWNSADNSLSITSSATFSFKATYSYIVQYAGASIYWSSVNVTPSSAPAARRVDGYKSEYEFRLELLKGEEKADQTFVKLTDDEHVTTGFEFNYDLSKEFNKNKANIYTMVSTTIDGDISVTQSAANVLPFMPEQTTVVPVGVKTTAAGEYTFSMPDGTDGIGVTLIDNVANTQTNLALGDYTVSLPAGTIDNRFSLSISPIQQAPTGLETIERQAAGEGARKVMVDGILYILRDGKVYDAQGRRAQ